MFVADGGELLAAQSYAKNMGLYGERVGALSIVSHYDCLAIFCYFVIIMDVTCTGMLYWLYKVMGQGSPGA